MLADCIYDASNRSLERFGKTGPTIRLGPWSREAVRLRCSAPPPDRVASK